MPNDADGNSVAVGSKPWYDDGHSVDQNGVPVWVQGTVQGFPTYPLNSVTISPSAGGPTVVVSLTLVHENKPPHPPDRG